MQENVIELPEEVCPPGSWTAENLLSWVYEGYENIKPAAWYDFYSQRAIVTPTNEAAEKLN
eukprot:9151102-Karenia_brevis.AAC.1